MRDRIALLLGLAVVWMLLWGDIRVANLVGGLAAGSLVLAMTPGPRLPRARRVRPIALARFMGRFAVDLVVASVTVARQVFWPSQRWKPQVVPVQLSSHDETVLAIVANTITLTPGTLTLEVDPMYARLLVHALHVDDDGAGVVTAAQHYERLVTQALPQRSEATI